jgi:hypothetical protein
MKDSLLANIKYVIPATTALLISIAPLNEQTILHGQDYSTPPKVASQDHCWDELSRNLTIPYFTYSKDIQQLEIIQNFAKNLIENMEELDPAIAEKVNENFWDLI